jgi:hypothetical protein
MQVPSKYISNKYRVLGTAILSIFLISGNAIEAQDKTQSEANDQTQIADPVKTCMAAQSEQPNPVKKGKNGPVKIVAKALANEFGNDSKNMLRDAIFVFSAQDVDPYDKHSPPIDKPYTVLEVQLIDGSQASVIKYPDDSSKIVGGFADGTIIIPASLGSNTYIVAYPNGVRGKMVRQSSSLYKIYRPDNTVTTVKKSMSGQFDITNDEIGFMGTAKPDRLGMQYEFKKNNYF